MQCEEKLKYEELRRLPKNNPSPGSKSEFQPRPTFWVTSDKSLYLSGPQILRFAKTTEEMVRKSQGRSGNFLPLSGRSIKDSWLLL